MNTSVSRKYIRADVTEKIATQTQKKVFEYKDKPGLFVCLFVFVCFLFFLLGRGIGFYGSVCIAVVLFNRKMI